MNKRPLTEMFCLLLFLAAGCSDKHQTHTDVIGTSVLGSFELGTNTSDSIIIFQKGRYSWIIGSNLVSMNIGLNQSVTFHLSTDGDLVQRIVLQLASNTNGAGFWVSDKDADGIPEQRRNAQTAELEVFICGAFHKLFYDGSHRYIISDAKTNEVICDHGNWKVSSQ